MGGLTASSAWCRLNGGPCDGDPVWVGPDCRQIVVTRDTDHHPWFRHFVVGDPPVVVATEAALYERASGTGDFTHEPRGLKRRLDRTQPVWSIREVT